MSTVLYNVCPICRESHFILEQIDPVSCVFQVCRVCGVIIGYKNIKYLEPESVWSLIPKSFVE